ncbi:MAG TPA: paraquat-inducible protein A [Alphaproteobacteria bacterium]|nr:paraquat-inducible protein A [Alphaproteobacteria bacterium]
MTIGCPDCGVLEDLPPLSHGAIAACRLCKARLEVTRGRSIAAGFACSLAVFVLLLPANLAPFLSVGMLGMTRTIHMGSGVAALWHGQWVVLAALIGAFVVLLPLLRFGLLSIVLGALFLGLRKSWLGPGYRWAMWLDQWAMPDVFLIGAAIGYSRVSVDIPVKIGWGGYCFAAAALLTMATRATIDRRAVWRAIGGERFPPAGEPSISCTTCDLVVSAAKEGDPCPRCGLRLHARKPHSISRTLALVIAGFALYLPSNLYPMSITMQIGQNKAHTIFSGIEDLFHAGLVPLGILIFGTSIAIPVLKLLGLSWFMLSTRLRSNRHLVLKTRLYRLIDELGRWSNIDPFTIAIIVPLFQFPPLVSSRAGPGATAFITVVAMTMAASQIFDPRLLWDAALEKPAER